MSSELGTVWRDSRVYGLGSLLNRLAGLLLIPVILHALPAEQWGIYVLILAVTGIVSVPVIAVIDTMIRLYFEDQDPARRRRVVSTIMALFALMAAGFAIAAAPLAGLLGALILGHQDHYWVFLVGLFVMIFDLLMGLVLDYFRIQKWPLVFVIATLARSVSQFALTILFVVGFGMGVFGVVLGSLLAAAAVSLPTAGFIVLRVGWAVDRSIIGEVVALGVPLMPAWLSKSAYPLVERQILNLLSGTASVGVFALGSRLAEQLGVLMQGPFADVWGVRLMEIAHDREKAREFNRVFLYFLFALTAAALGLSLYAPELVTLLSGPDYWSAMTLVPILALAQIGVAINYHFEVCLIQIKATGSLAIVNCSGLLVATVALYFLTLRFGLLGAAAGALLAQVYRLAASVWFVARRSDYARLFPWRSGLILLGLAIASFLCAHILGGQALSPTVFFLKGLIFLAFVAGVYVSPALTLEERGAIRDYCRGRLLAISRGPGK